MKAVVAAVLVAAVLAASGAEQAGGMGPLKASYDSASAKLEALRSDAYGKLLREALADAKDKGDLEGYGTLDTERTRFESERSVPAGNVLPTEYEAKVAKLSQEHLGRQADLLRKYVPALDALLKRLMKADRMDEAKAAKEEKDKAEFALADAESKLPKALEALPSAAPPEAKKLMGHSYLVVWERKTWHEAKEACEEAGGHLVTIANRTEDQFVDGLLPQRDRVAVWIGCTDEEKDGEWLWVDGTEVRYSGWLKRLVSKDRKGPESYGIWGEWKGNGYGRGWNDVKADNAEVVGYVCEWEN